MRRLTTRMPQRGRHRQSGLSLVELMIGCVLGLFIIAGATTLFVSNLSNSRRMLVEARMDQDLRAAADLIARDLRRAGYWGNAVQTTFTTAAGTRVSNPYDAITPASDSIEYAYASGSTCAAGSAPCTNEQYKFDVNAGALRIRLDSSSQDLTPVTDPNIMTIVPRVTANPIPVPLGASCSTPCTSANCPTATVRLYTIDLVGTSPANSTDIVQRRLTTTTRVRNDQIAGNCP
jgi:type IV pilus assembly protein PilW